jgi:hypothetical protein
VVWVGAGVVVVGGGVVCVGVVWTGVVGVVAGVELVTGVDAVSTGALVVGVVADVEVVWVAERWTACRCRGVRAALWWRWEGVWCVVARAE